MVKFIYDKIINSDIAKKPEQGIKAVMFVD